MAEATGRIVQVTGGVVDVDFGDNILPEVYHAIEVVLDDQAKLVLEVQNQLGNGWVRTVSMDSTDGLRRGMDVINTGSAIKVPVGESSLGRVFNVLGEPIDGGPEVIAEEYYPIHRLAPSFDEQSTSVEVFETGIKVIDLLEP